MKSLLLCALLLLPVSAGAVPYTASVVLDLTTLRFSGIPVSQSLIIPGDGPFAPNIEVEQRATYIYDIPSNHIRRAEYIASYTHLDGATTSRSPQGSTATAFGDSSQLSSAVNLVDSGFASSTMAQTALLTASAAGPLTISIDFTLSHSPFLANDPDFFSIGRAGLAIGTFGDPNLVTDYRDLRFFVGERDDVPLFQRGTMSATYLFEPGQSTLLVMFTTVTASVPEPKTWLLCLIGLVIVGGFLHIRRIA